MRIKICGITKPEQGQEIADLGATALGFICVPSSPRYVTQRQIQTIVKQISLKVDLIGVFAGANLTQIREIVPKTGLTAVQLHGNESPEFCRHLKQALPHIELIKAFRVKNAEVLIQISPYFNWVDTLLLDAYHPQQLGGTGYTLNWESLTGFNPPIPWFLAGGLTPDNVIDALTQLHPTGIDLSSGVERSPGDKNLTKVRRLFEILAEIDAK
ncbi:phosphoribosylanthranilate isomerase [Aphanothece sacrum]|uniref:N-(5'-phosphoribosyl)anthranilate isomerase n=1 Tax=Aphanothece sacrum FPU1 TaxID=1920663 RepID=A0A401IL79_APHSA|nr:phosphoribosylanthranilate isomerase [Aphanothece sacrum]GBF82010.1 N-(5'-phosphoribosyl)anthranilate isomerase [Aphanothece sacrum FPU1]GBF83640.1 N-(5'-phosphoribosyl)anthranilate isomerase [Aphanothece sacrum FPU3]